METVAWSPLDWSDGITFGFVSPPFQYLRPIIDPFIGAFSLSRWILGALGLIGTLFISAIAKPVFIDIVQKKLRLRLERSAQTKATQEPQAKEPITVSGKGQESQAVSEQESKT